ncbi:MAG: hypothetical protein ACO1SX_11515 [Actinomycetota bacterium]
MRSKWLATLAILVPAVAAADQVTHTRLPEGTPVVIVGRVSSPPSGAIGEQKMQVALGPSRVDYTLHFGDASVLKGPNGEEIDEDAFDDGQWVRAEGRIMDDPRRIMVSRARIVSTRKIPTLRGTPYNRGGYSLGYLQWPAGEARVAGWRGTITRRSR